MPVKVQEADFDVAVEIDALTAGRADVGGLASFIGLVRGDDDLIAMTLEHYPGMTEARIAAIEAEAHRRWPLLGTTVIHRVGRLLPGARIVLVAVASRHRQAAFEAAEFLMDYLKTRAPFWKCEERPDGARWVEAWESDDVAAARWGAAAS